MWFAESGVDKYGLWEGSADSAKSNKELPHLSLIYLFMEKILMITPNLVFK